MNLNQSIIAALICLVLGSVNTLGQEQWITNEWATESSPDKYILSSNSARLPLKEDSYFRGEKKNVDVRPEPVVDKRTSPDLNSFEPVSSISKTQAPGSGNRGVVSRVSNEWEVQDQDVPPANAVTIPDFMLEASRASDISRDEPVSSDPSVNYSIYRDRSLFPTAPKKPCNRCSRPGETLPCTNHPLPGFRGRPHIDQEPGGCRCGNRCCGSRKPGFSQFWPRPFSGWLDELFPRCAAERYLPCQRHRLVDIFDGLENFRLINYTRTDNGYCGDCFGRNRDYYGCPGQSYFEAWVQGVGFRQPGEPISPGAQQLRQRGAIGNAKPRRILRR